MYIRLRAINEFIHASAAGGARVSSRNMYGVYIYFQLNQTRLCSLARARAIYAKPQAISHRDDASYKICHPQTTRTTLVNRDTLQTVMGLCAANCRFVVLFFVALIHTVTQSVARVDTLAHMSAHKA